MIDTLTFISVKVCAAISAFTPVAVVKWQTVTFAAVDKITFVDASLIGSVVQVKIGISTVTLEATQNISTLSIATVRSLNFALNK